MIYDIIIIGAGPAGLTGAVYARRADKSVLVIERETFGGQITHSPKVENYPGTIAMSGSEFGEKLLEQADKLGTDIEMDEILSVEVDGEIKRAIGESGVYEGRSIIVATGSQHRQLGLANENDFVGKGISYCSVCDGAFYRDMDVAVIGGGNSALQEAVMLSDICKSVTIIQNLDFFTGEKKLLDILESKPNVQFITGVVVSEIKGDNSLSGIVIENTKTSEKTSIDVDGVFVAIGQVPKTEAVSKVLALDGYGYIKADESCHTEKNGVFVAGDCRTKSVRQIVTAVADGAAASIAACRYVDNL